MSGPLSVAAVVALAASCAPSIAPETLLSVVQAESGRDPLAINVNRPGGGTRRPETLEAAIAVAAEAMREGWSVDLGLAQINTANLPRLGMSLADAFDPCRNLSAADRVLRDGWAAGAGEADPQTRLRVAFSHYNTGNQTRGFANGYVGRVERAAGYVVPAIRLPGQPAPSSTAEAAVPAAVIPPADPPGAPPSWDVMARAEWELQQAGRQAVQAAPITQPDPAGEPVRLRVRAISPSDGSDAEAPAFRLSANTPATLSLTEGTRP